MILREVRPQNLDPKINHTANPTRSADLKRSSRRCARRLGLPSNFTFDACRHGGMTELEEAELTDGQGRALSAHSSKAYEGYAKRTQKRALAATRKRHAYVLADKERTEFQNETPDQFQNGNRKIPNAHEIAIEIGWGAWIRTREWRNQNPLPYHLATPHRDACRCAPAHGGASARNIPAHPRPINAAVACLWSIFAAVFA